MYYAYNDAFRMQTQARTKPATHKPKKRPAALCSGPCFRSAVGVYCPGATPAA